MGVVVFLLLVIAAIALGILGIVVKGLLYLLFSGIGLLVVAFLLGAFWMRRRNATIQLPEVTYQARAALPLRSRRAGPAGTFPVRGRPASAAGAIAIPPLGFGGIPGLGPGTAEK